MFLIGVDIHGVDLPTFLTFRTEIAQPHLKTPKVRKVLPGVKGRSVTLRGRETPFGGVGIFWTSLCEVTLCASIVGSFKAVSWQEEVIS